MQISCIIPDVRQPEILDFVLDAVTGWDFGLSLLGEQGGRQYFSWEKEREQKFGSQKGRL